MYLVARGIEIVFWMLVLIVYVCLTGQMNRDMNCVIHAVYYLPLGYKNDINVTEAASAVR